MRATVQVVVEDEVVFDGKPTQLKVVRKASIDQDGTRKEIMDVFKKHACQGLVTLIDGAFAGLEDAEVQVRKEIEAAKLKAKQEEEAKAKKEAEEKVKQEAEAKAKKEADAKKGKETAAPPPKETK